VIDFGKATIREIRDFGPARPPVAGRKITHKILRADEGF
jgi:hypothetical protein